MPASSSARNPGLALAHHGRELRAWRTHAGNAQDRRFQELDVALGIVEDRRLQRGDADIALSEQRQIARIRHRRQAFDARLQSPRNRRAGSARRQCASRTVGPRAASGAARPAPPGGNPCIMRLGARAIGDQHALMRHARGCTMRSGQIEAFADPAHSPPRSHRSRPPRASPAPAGLVEAMPRPHASSARRYSTTPFEHRSRAIPARDRRDCCSACTAPRRRSGHRLPRPDASPAALQMGDQRQHLLGCRHAIKDDLARGGRSRKTRIGIVPVDDTARPRPAARNAPVSATPGIWRIAAPISSATISTDGTIDIDIGCACGCTALIGRGGLLRPGAAGATSCRRPPSPGLCAPPRPTPSRLARRHAAADRSPRPPYCSGSPRASTTIRRKGKCHAPEQARAHRGPCSLSRLARLPAPGLGAYRLGSWPRSPRPDAGALPDARRLSLQSVRRRVGASSGAGRLGMRILLS